MMLRRMLRESSTMRACGADMTVRAGKHSAGTGLAWNTGVKDKAREAFDRSHLPPSGVEVTPRDEDSQPPSRGKLLKRHLSEKWFARPVLFVADIDKSVDFYVKQLGFTQPWRYEEAGEGRVAQVDRQGCEVILSSQWPDKVGKGLLFISLEVATLNLLRKELEERGVLVKDGQWGYRVMVITHPDGNELYFPYPK
jgi:catechol 2,3-dioxygenase-like lactoylglutathione lyase family enzyme